MDYKGRFINLFNESTIIQGVVTLVFTGVISYLYVVRGDVPESLINLLAIILGFWFGSKVKISRK